MIRELNMNIFKKTYCRIFQVCFRAALPVLPYRSPEIFETVHDVPELLKKHNLYKPLIVTDKTIHSLKLTEELENALADSGIDFVVFDETVPNPSTAIVEAALKTYNQNSCNALIAFGGGSPMDCAKAVGARVARPNKTLSEIAGILRVIKKIPLLIAIPTTSGTGSETTLAAIITDSETRHKYAINDFPLIPDYAVLDPNITHSLPYGIAATTGMDALTHAVEAYIGRSTSKQTRSDSEKAVELIFKNIENAAEHKSYDAEKAMLYASHYAGRAFTRSYVGYVHAVSHSLSGEYNMPHGLTNAIILPIVLKKYGEAVYKKLACLAKFANIGDNNDSDKVRAEKFISAIESLNKKLGIPSKISGIKTKDIPKLAAYADKETNPLYPVPILWNAKELEEIYYEIME